MSRSDRPQGVPADPPIIRWIHHVSRGFAVLAAIGIVLVMLATVIDVSRRYLTGSGLVGVVEATEISLPIIVFFAIAYAQLRDDHVATTIVTSRLDSGTVRVLRSVGLLIVFVIVGLMLWRTSLRAIVSTSSGEYRIGILKVPVWPARIAIPIGLTVFLAELAADLYSLVIRRTPAETPPDLKSGESPL